MASQPSPSLLYRSDRAFTVMELMIVIGIAALLMVLLLGVLPQVTLSAKATVNLNNHRAITAALIRYAYDHRSTLPYSYQDTPAMPSMTYTRELAMLGYINDPRVFFSPLVGQWYKGGALASPQKASTIPWFYTNYSANRNGAMPYSTETDGARRPANLGRVAADGNIARLMLLRDSYDSSWDSPDNPDKSRGGGRVWFSGEGYLPPPAKSYHGKIHASFADGHTAAINREELLNLMQVPNQQPPLFNETYTR